ncbi:MAG: hypothetical protein ACOYOF_03940 [Verrucomicrobiaceae bacterium]
MKGIVRWWCLIAALLLGGCLPEERIWWSPQGDRAIVLVDDHLHLVTANGELGKALLNGASIEDWLVKTLSWLPDGTGFVCSRVRRVPTWEEAKPLIATEEVKRIESWLPTVLPTLKSEIARIVEPSGINSLQPLLPGENKQLFEIGLRILVERHRADVEQVLRKLPQGDKIASELNAPAGRFPVQELCIVKLDQPLGSAPQGIAWSLLELPIMPKVSPKHNAIAFLQLSEDTETAQLNVMTLDGKSRLTIAHQVSSGSFQWMPDGRTLVFTKPLGQQGDSVQSIQQVTVLQPSGALMKPPYDPQPDGSLLKVNAPDRLAEPKLLAMALLPGSASLRPLPDGRILFASQPITLPVVESRPKLEPLLHLISADGRSLSTIPTAPGDLPTDLNYLVPSPDGTHVAVVEAETDAVAIVELSTGKTEIISAPHSGWKCETIPAWKSATELTFAALGTDTRTPQWMLWSTANGTRSISDKWPATATTHWLSAPIPPSP